MLSLTALPGRITGVDLADFCRAAATLKCGVANIRAVDAVESAGRGFLSSGRPKILFEGHLFHKFTEGRYSKSHPTISYPKWTKTHYLGGEAEYGRLEEAYRLDPSAALRAASWSRYQILGDNFASCGYKSVEAFVAAMFADEGNSLDAFVQYITKARLVDSLRKGNWGRFADGYNGHAYKRNQYDTKMANAFAGFAKLKIDCGALASPAPTPVDVALPAVCHDSCTGLNNTSLDDRYLNPPATDKLDDDNDDQSSDNTADTPSTDDTVDPQPVPIDGNSTPDKGGPTTSPSDKIGTITDKLSGYQDKWDRVVATVTRFLPESIKARVALVLSKLCQLVIAAVAFLCGVPFKYWAAIALILLVGTLVYLYRRPIMAFFTKQR